jgi:hypothetical protein
MVTRTFTTTLTLAVVITMTAMTVKLRGHCRDH